MAVTGIDKSFEKKLNQQIGRGLNPHLKNLTKENGAKGDFRLRTFDFDVIYQDDTNKIRRLSVGKTNDLRYTVTVLLVGASGAGKSALVNSLINQAYGVKFHDTFRLKLVEKDCSEKEGQHVSQTDWITVYQFNKQVWMPIDFNLVLIDTPGIADTRGLEFDKKLFDRMETLFKEEAFGVDELNCIGLVTPSSEARLTDKQKYIFDSCMRIFGLDVKDIIHIMATFSDGSDPKVLCALDAARIEYHSVHQINNSSLYVSNSSKVKTLKKNEILWDEMEESATEIFEYLQGSKSKSLTLTPSVLENRRVLNDKCRVLELKLQVILSKANSYKEMQRALQKNEGTQLKLTILEPIQVPYEKNALNCLKCQVTCHKPCPRNCKICKEMSDSGNIVNCKVCKCKYLDHEKENSYFKLAWKQDLKHVDKRYKDQVIKEANETTKELIQCLREVKECVKNLKAIALRSKHLSLESYISNLIEDEKQVDANSHSQKVRFLHQIQEAEKMTTEALNNDEQLMEMVDRLELADKTLDNKQNKCSLM